MYCDKRAESCVRCNGTGDVAVALYNYNGGSPGVCDINQNIRDVIRFSVSDVLLVVQVWVRDFFKSILNTR